MKADLAHFESETRAAIDAARVLFASLSPAQMTARPLPAAWSAAECLEHLTLTAEAFLPALDGAIAQSEYLSDRAYVPGWLGRWFLAQIDGPAPRAFPAPPQFHPRSASSGAQALEAYCEAHEKMLARIPNLEPLDLGRIRVRSPFARWIYYPVGLTCYLIPAHCRRHLAQARAAAGLAVPTRPGS